MFERSLFLVVLAGAVWAQSPEHNQVEIYGQKINYLEAGSGPEVILLHGLGGDSSNWSFTIPALAKSFHVYVPDQVGFGESDKPLINYRVATLVDFLDGFCRKLAISKATIVGNSLGGWVALDFALGHPEKVTKLVLVDSAGYSQQRTGGAPLARDVLLRLNPSTLEDTRKLMAVVFYNKNYSSEQVAEMGFVRHLHKNDSPTINAFIDSILRGEDMLDGKLGAVKAPTLIMWGREDALITLKAAKAFAEDIAGSQSVVLDGCGHVPQVECAGTFNEALGKFLAQP